MNASRVWTRVSKAERCGICEKPDWCTRGEKGWCCMRVESGKMLKNGGWYHPFDASRPLPPPPQAASPAAAPDIDLGLWMERYWSENHPELDAHAEAMGVSGWALRALRAAWAPDRRALAIPMYDGTCADGSRPIGIRLRCADGRKLSVRGSRSGFFYPYLADATLLTSRRLYICEGPTDTAAALDLGCLAIGRASCRGGQGYILQAIEQMAPVEVIVVTDNDGPGWAGANELLEHIDHPARMITPPTKDLRAFVRARGTKEALDSLMC